MTDFVLLISSVIILISSIFLYFTGKKRNINAIGLWVAAPAFRGLNWFVEFLADEYSTFGDRFLVDRIEISFAFLASYCLFGAVLAYSNRYSESQSLAIITPVSFLSVLFMFILPEPTIISIEDTELFSIGELETESLRFTYGFLVPFLSFILVVNFIRMNPSTGRQLYTQVMITILLFLSSIFEGFDNDNSLYNLTRSVILFSVVFLPLILIIMTEIELKNLLIINGIGFPLFAYSFETMKSGISTQEVLTSGYITALLGLSEEISSSQTSLSIRSGNMYYVVEKTSNGLCGLQSSAVNDKLEDKFHEFVGAINDKVILAHQHYDINVDEFISIIHEIFQPFIRPR